MEKDLGRIKKNPETEIVVRIDDFGGRPGLTIREFVSSESYTGFTKSGTRIPAENFEEFKKMINSVKPEDMSASSENKPVQKPFSTQKPFSKPTNSFSKPSPKKEEIDEDDISGIDEDGLM
jgi:hypothetical protein